MRRFLLSLVTGLVCWCATASAGWHEDTQPIMGTRVHVEFWLEDGDTRGPELLERCMAEMRRIDDAFNPWKETSELSRLNRDAPKGYTPVSAEMMHLLDESAAASKRSDGAFDITFASVGRYFDYRAGRVPTAEEKKAVEAINWRFVELDQKSQRVRYAHPRTYVDLGGIAKGHAVDQVIGILKEENITAASVAAGGDSRIIGDRKGEPWTVGVRDPRKADGVAVLLPLIDTAVSTSGDYERYFEKDGVRFHHILDPATGVSAKGSMSVTIIAPSATLSDALSTTVFVMGPDKGLALINRMPGIDAIVITDTGKLLYSDSLMPLQPETP